MLAPARLLRSFSSWQARGMATHDPVKPLSGFERFVRGLRSSAGSSKRPEAETKWSQLRFDAGLEVFFHQPERGTTLCDITQGQISSFFCFSKRQMPEVALFSSFRSYLIDRPEANQRQERFCNVASASASSEPRFCPKPCLLRRGGLPHVSASLLIRNRSQ